MLKRNRIGYDCYSPSLIIDPLRILKVVGPSGDARRHAPPSLIIDPLRILKEAVSRMLRIRVTRTFIDYRSVEDTERIGERHAATSLKCDLH